MNIDMKYTVDIMTKLLEIPSPSGDSRKCIDLIESEFRNFGVEVFRTRKNALIATINGEDNDNQKTIAAHIDTIGAMVKEIKPNGRLKLAQIGGFAWNSVEGESVIIKTRKGKEFEGTILPVEASVHIFRDVAREKLRTDENMEVRIDEFVYSEQDVLDLGINIGDLVSFEPRTRVLENGFIKSRHLDDKSAVAIVLAMCKYIKENNISLKYTTNFIISNYEEVLHGISYMPEKTDEFIAIDIGTVGKGQESDEFSVCIAARDASGPYNVELRNRLIDVAESNGIYYKIDLYNGYGSDASAAVRQGFDVNYACVGPGVDATHHYERTHVKSIENTTKLLLKYIIK